MDPRVKVGMVVLDADGKRLGKISRCDPWGFEVVKGFWSPAEWTIRWEEVTAVARDEVRVSRGDEDLFVLAAGGLPERFRKGTPHA